MSDVATVILIGLTCISIPAIGSVASEISHKRRMKRFAAAQKRVSQALRKSL